jgi:prepilin-type N-terminal cleavage/methylation domain-containing protein
MKGNSEHRNLQGNTGFTLVELLVAVTLLAIGILSVGQIFAVSARNASYGRTETVAVSLAREIQEKVLSESVEQVQAMFNGVDTNDPGTVTVPCTVWAQHLADQLGSSGRGRIWVRDSTEDANLLPGMFSVEIEISWLREGETMTVPLRFAITEIGG